MRPKFLLSVVALWVTIIHANYAQYVRVSFPLDRQVMQRNSSNQAQVVFAGQVTTYSSAPGQFSTMQWRVSTLNSSNQVVSTGAWNTIGMQSLGQFFTTQTFNKGWYQVEFQFNGIISSATRFGVGDVFVVAGQSNAQGVQPNGTWSVPNASSVPEWIISADELYSCTQSLPQVPITFKKIDGLNRIAPTGVNSWCYAILGKQISDNNGGMPVLFFNAANGGSTIDNWTKSSNDLNPATNSIYTGVQYCCTPDQYSAPQILDSF